MTDPYACPDAYAIPTTREEIRVGRLGYLHAVRLEQTGWVCSACRKREPDLQSACPARRA